MGRKVVFLTMYQGQGSAISGNLKGIFSKVLHVSHMSTDGGTPIGWCHQASTSDPPPPHQNNPVQAVCAAAYIVLFIHHFLCPSTKQRAQITLPALEWNDS